MRHLTRAELSAMSSEEQDAYRARLVADADAVIAQIDAAIAQDEAEHGPLPSLPQCPKHFLCFLPPGHDGLCDTKYGPISPKAGGSGDEPT